MGWVERKPAPHYCNKPTVGDYPNYEFGDGSIWQCDWCQKKWIWHEWILWDGDQWEAYESYQKRQAEYARQAAERIDKQPVKKKNTRWWKL